MNHITKEQIEHLRSRYPEGTRIRLDHMNDPYAPIEPGTMGTLKFIDDGGTFHMSWDNGRTLGLVYGEDQFTVVPNAQQVAEGLPEMCYSVLPSTGELICIKRGESGYYPSGSNVMNFESNKNMANYLNEQLKVSAAQRTAMEIGSMYGWHVPGADPKTHETAHTPDIQDTGQAPEQSQDFEMEMM